MGELNRAKRALTRRFGLLDAMIAVFALAPAFVVFRHQYDILDQHASLSAFNTQALLVAVGNSLLMSLTLALTLIGLRSPRPPLRIGLRRPGMAACVAATAAIAVLTTRATIKAYAFFVSPLVAGESFDFRYLFHSIPGDQMRIGFAVIGAWVMLLLTRAWRSEATWLDRSGRVLGWFWIGMLIFYVMFPWIEPFLPML